jgi:hypothetical protein
MIESPNPITTQATLLQVAQKLPTNHQLKHMKRHRFIDTQNLPET